MTGDKHERIRLRAYELWVQAGKPHGDHLQHWDVATAEIEAQDAQAGSPTAEQVSGAGPALAAHSKDAKPKKAAAKAPAAVKAPAGPRKAPAKPA